MYKIENIEEQMSMVRILHISNEDDSYGSAKCLQELLIEELEDGEIKPIVITPVRNKMNKFCDEYEIENYSCSYMSFMYMKHDNMATIKFVLRKIQYNILKIWAQKKIPRYVNMDLIDLIHTNNAAYDIGAILALKYSIPHIWHLREGGLKHFNYVPYFNNAFAYMNSLSNCFIAVSEFVKEEWVKLGLDKDKIKVLYDGVNVRGSKLALNNNIYKIKIVMIGTIMEPKGQKILVEALENLGNSYLDKVEVHFYGYEEGEYYNDIKRYIREKKMENVVFFEGYSKDVWKELLKYDMGVNCSKAEAFGRCTAEYLIAGLPVLAFDTGANSELIGEYGVLCKNYNVASFSSKLKYMIDNIDDFRRKKEEIRNYGLEKFSIETNSFKIIECFKERCIK